MTLQYQQTTLSPQVENLVVELNEMIDQARASIAMSINSTLSLLHWHLGSRIYKEILKEERAEYGRAIVPTVSRQLTFQYGKGFTEKGLRRMIQFAETFPDEQIVATLSRRCRDVVTTIELEPLCGTHPNQRNNQTGLLRRDVSFRTVERSDSTKQN